MKAENLANNQVVVTDGKKKLSLVMELQLPSKITARLLSTKNIGISQPLQQSIFQYSLVA